MSSPTSAIVSATGITAPTTQAILAYLLSQAQTIFGSDAILSADSQDGQLIGVFAQAISDSNTTASAVYNSFNPGNAIGTGLSSVVNINGLEREVATNSQVNVNAVGVAGTVVPSGIVADTNGNQYQLAPFTIPSGGTITVTGTATSSGNIVSAANTVTTIVNPTNGWQTVTNPAASVPGAPIESDAALKARQSESVAIPSLTALDGIVGAVGSITGVTSVAGYENDTNTTDSNGLPPHSIAIVVQGGSATTIANTIATKKTPGGYTYGTTSEIVYDEYGLPHTIRFFVPTQVSITVAITLQPTNGYTSVIGTEIQTAVTNYINDLGIGQNVSYTKLFVPANLSGTGNGTDGNTYEITAMTINGSPADVAIAFNDIAVTSAVNLTVL